jgi:hypothetical protein
MITMTRASYYYDENGFCETMEYNERTETWTRWDWQHDLDMVAKRQQRAERQTGVIENCYVWRASSDGSSSIGYSTLSAIGDGIAEMYGKEYSENFLKNF